MGKKKIVLIIILILLVGCSDQYEAIDLDSFSGKQKELYKEFYNNDIIFEGEYFDVVYNFIEDDFINTDKTKIRETEYKSGPNNSLMILDYAYTYNGALVELSVVPKTTKEFKNLNFVLKKGNDVIGSSPYTVFNCRESICVNISEEDSSTFGPYYPHFLFLYEGYEIDGYIYEYNGIQNFRKEDIKKLHDLTLEVVETPDLSKEKSYIVDEIKIKYSK